ncbi:MAG TPA: glycosyltransferase family 9 protein, partial [Gemmatimonadaceae bacterium]|nr:glycosyltransferase family 9 protein [Gemmatimonadaceae bacterium]
VGAGGFDNHRVYNVRVKQFDRVTHYIEASKALIEPFGADPADYDWRPEIFLSGGERSAAEAAWDAAATRVGQPQRPRFLVNLSASEKLRRWPDERFIESMSLVRERYPHMPAIVIALPAEADRARAVAHAIGAHHIPTPKLRDALALVASSDLVFTPDTSISHAASAFDKPAVVLIRADSTAYAPWQNRGELVLWTGQSIDALPTAEVMGPLLRLCEEFGNYRSGTAKTS